MTSTQNTFANGLKDTFNKHTNMNFGENGASEHSPEGMGSSRRVEGALVAWNAGITRNAPVTKVNELVDNVFKSLGDNADESCEDVINLFKSVFVKRDCREGEGERMVVYHALFKLYDYYPNTVLKLIEIIPDFGYWKDMQNLYLMAYQLRPYVHPEKALAGMMDEQYHKGQAIMKRIREIWKINFEKDWKTYCSQKSGEVGSLTLMTKYWPKEGRSLDKKTKIGHILAKEIIDIDTGKSIGLRTLRYRLSEMNEAINTTEVLMSAKRWDELKFNLVPSRLMALGKNAFLNVNKYGDMRHPNDAIRMQCRNNLLNHIELAKQGKVKVHGGQLFIHEIIKQYIGNRSAWDFKPTVLSQELQDICELQWSEHRNKLLKIVKENENCNLDKTLVLSDFSGSMHGDPILVSTAMALMISSITNGPFADMFMTFNSKPELLKINRSDSLYDKIKYVVGTPWGGNTDFMSAFDRILETCYNNNLKPDDLPKQIMVISDMQFDSAHFNKTGVYDYISSYTNIPIKLGSSKFGKTHHEILIDAFHNAGVAICGQPYKLPTMIYWNVRGDTRGYPVQADTPNTQMLTGFSVQMIKNLLNGQEIKEPTPYDNFLQSVSHERYDIVRQIIENVAEPELFVRYAIKDSTSEQGTDVSDTLSDWDNITHNDTEELNSIRKRMEDTQLKMAEMMEQLKKFEKK